MLPADTTTSASDKTTIFAGSGCKDGDHGSWLNCTCLVRQKEQRPLLPQAKPTALGNVYGLHTPEPGSAQHSCNTLLFLLY
jgi:hypothetical protein